MTQMVDSVGWDHSSSVVQIGQLRKDILGGSLRTTFVLYRVYDHNQCSCDKVTTSR
jgi:hypothetical protein